MHIPARRLVFPSFSPSFFSSILSLFFSPTVSALALMTAGACATKPSWISRPRANSSSPVTATANKPVTAQANGTVQILDLGAVALTSRPHAEIAPLRAEPWQWRGRNALGAPPQSFVAPQFLGGDDVLISTLGGGVGVYNVRTGAAKWKLEIPVGVASRPLVMNASLIVAGMDGLVRKLRLEDGHLEWSSRVSAESLGGVSAAQGFVFVTTGDDALWALDEKTGASRWTYKRPSPQGSVYWSLRGTALPVLSPDGKKVYAGFSDGYFVALEVSSGQTAWERNFDRAGRFKDADTPAVLSRDGELLYLALVDGDLLALRTRDGTTLWSVTGGGGGTPFVDEDEGALYVASNQHSIQKIALKDSKLLWTASLANGGLGSTPVPVIDGSIAVSSSHGGFLILDRQTGQVQAEKEWRPGFSAPPAFDGRRLVLLSERNTLLIYRLQAKAREG